MPRIKISIRKKEPELTLVIVHPKEQKGCRYCLHYCCCRFKDYREQVAEIYPWHFPNCEYYSETSTRICDCG